MQYKGILILIAFTLSVQLSMAQSDLQGPEVQFDSGSLLRDFSSQMFSSPPDEDSKQHQWKDGDYTITLWESEDVVMERFDKDESPVIDARNVLATDGNLRIVKKRDSHQFGDDVFPVLINANGGWRALPGGVLVVFLPDMQKAGIDAFFSKMNLSGVTEMEFTKNAYFIETQPGIASLELSNKLTDAKEVKLVSPNWWAPVELR